MVSSNIYLYQSKNIQMFQFGGNVDDEVLDKILSIGYELETGMLSKLSLLTSVERILLNTDTAPADMKGIAEAVGGMDDEDDDEDQFYFRREELIDLDSYTTSSLNNPNDKNKQKNDENVVFLSTNDISKSIYGTYLEGLCDRNENELEDIEDTDDIDDDAVKYKNSLYQFHPNDPNEKPFNINFDTKSKQLSCGTFTNSEWIFTYYNPKRSRNIILETFSNAIKNLSFHLDQLVSIPGKLKMLSGTLLTTLPNPLKRTLYHFPRSNMYYLPVHSTLKEPPLSDVRVVPQMTFSCRVQNVASISKGLLSLLGFKASAIYTLEELITDLFIEYNAVCKPDRQFNNLSRQALFQAIKNYILLIFYKLYQYYNLYLQSEGVKGILPDKYYLKDFCYINTRHTNYILYLELKKCISEYFMINDERTVIDILFQVIFQKEILEEFLIEEPENVRKNAFSPTNILPINHPQYGNPVYSLISYFSYFDKPPPPKSIYHIQYHDWLQYIGVDIFSTQMDIQPGNIVLVELRSFGSMLRESEYFKDRPYTGGGTSFSIGALMEFTNEVAINQSERINNNVGKKRNTRKSLRRQKNLGITTRITNGRTSIRSRNSNRSSRGSNRSSNRGSNRNSNGGSNTSSK